MSAHLMVVAGYLDLPPAHKLALIKFADSADDQNRLGFPGMDAVLAWAGVGRKRGYEVVADLQDRGLLLQVARGHRGQRAVFKVFPDPGDVGCAPEGETPGRARFAGVPAIPGKEAIKERAARGAAARSTTHAEPEPEAEEEGSPPGDPNEGGEGSPPGDPMPAERVTSERERVTSERERVGVAPSPSVPNLPSSPSEEHPLPPQSGGRSTPYEDAGCARHLRRRRGCTACETGVPHVGYGQRPDDPPPRPAPGPRTEEARAAAAAAARASLAAAAASRRARADAEARARAEREARLQQGAVP